MIYYNPIIKGMNPDPSVCFDGHKYYLVTSSFEFFPGVPIYESDNLVNWTLVGHCLTDSEQCDLKNAWNSGGIYAPTIRYYQGLYYMVTTNVSSGGHFIVHTKNPREKWSRPVYIDQGGIDPSLCFEDDKVYFTSNSVIDHRVCIITCEVNPITGEKYTESRVISYGTGGKHAEAPHIYKKDGYYYLMLAEGGTEYGHMEVILRSKDIYGPYEECPHNPILSHKEAPMNVVIQCTGHGDLIEDENKNWWMVCLGVRPIGPMLHNLGRETFLVPVRWEDGWPFVGENGRISLEMEGQVPSIVYDQCDNFTDLFNESVLDKKWTFIRNPKQNSYKLENSAIILKGCGMKLNEDKGNPTFIGIRQGEFETRTSVNLRTVEDGTRAGIVAYYNSNYYYALQISKEVGRVYIELEKQIHDEHIISKRIEIEESDVYWLQIRSDKEYYYFDVISNEKKVEVGKGAVAGLCTEGTMTMTFTGVFLGLHSIHGEATFETFEYFECKKEKN